MTHTPRSAAQLGLCEQELEQWMESEAHLDEALAATSDDWVGLHRKALESSQKAVRTELAEIRIAGSPEISSRVVDRGLIKRRPS